MTRIQKMSDEALRYTRNDLNEVIAIQEQTAKLFGACAVPKLGAYWDTLSDVIAEMNKRGIYPHEEEA